MGCNPIAFKVHKKCQTPINVVLLKTKDGTRVWEWCPSCKRCVTPVHQSEFERRE